MESVLRRPYLSRNRVAIVASLMVFASIAGACQRDDTLVAASRAISVPPRVDFGTGYVGDSLSVDLEISGLGQASLNIIEISSGLPINIGLEAPIVLPGGDIAKIPLNWAPTQAAQLDRILRFQTDEEGEPEYSVRVTGVARDMPDCDDSNMCTVDRFDRDEERCVYENAVGFCDDGNACTVNDQCVNGACFGQARSCDDDNVCTLNLCDPEQGCEFPPDPDICDDGDPCTDDICDPDGGCEFPSAANWTPCGDADCATADLCFFGECRATDISAHSDGFPCSDGDVCTEGDSCLGGECNPGELLREQPEVVETYELYGQADGRVSVSPDGRFAVFVDLRTIHVTDIADFSTEILSAGANVLRPFFRLDMPGCDQAVFVNNSRFAIACGENLVFVQIPEPAGGELVAAAGSIAQGYGWPNHEGIATRTFVQDATIAHLASGDGVLAWATNLEGHFVVFVSVGDWLDADIETMSFDARELVYHGTTIHDLDVRDGRVAWAVSDAVGWTSVSAMETGAPDPIHWHRTHGVGGPLRRLALGILEEQAVAVVATEDSLFPLWLEPGPAENPCGSDPSGCYPVNEVPPGYQTFEFGYYPGCRVLADCDGGSSCLPISSGGSSDCDVPSGYEPDDSYLCPDGDALSACLPQDGFRGPVVSVPGITDVTIVDHGVIVARQESIEFRPIAGLGFAWIAVYAANDVFHHDGWLVGSGQDPFILRITDVFDFSDGAGNRITDGSGWVPDYDSFVPMRFTPVYGPWMGTANHLREAVRNHVEYVAAEGEDGIAVEVEPEAVLMVAGERMLGILPMDSAGVRSWHPIPRFPTQPVERGPSVSLPTVLLGREFSMALDVSPWETSRRWARGLELWSYSEVALPSSDDTGALAFARRYMVLSGLPDEFRNQGEIRHVFCSDYTLWLFIAGDPGRYVLVEFSMSTGDLLSQQTFEFAAEEDPFAVPTEIAQGRGPTSIVIARPQEFDAFFVHGGQRGWAGYSRAPDSVSGTVAFGSSMAVQQYADGFVMLNGDGRTLLNRYPVALWADTESASTESDAYGASLVFSEDVADLAPKLQVLHMRDGQAWVHTRKTSAVRSQSYLTQVSYAPDGTSLHGHGSVALPEEPRAVARQGEQTWVLGRSQVTVLAPACEASPRP